MVTGQQTVDFDLCNVEYSKLAICWGMNWISTKMPDAHWLTEARAKGTKVVVVSTEYNSTCSKADEIVIIRPGTDPALALGIAREIIDEGLYDEGFVKGHTDLPLLVRMDTQELLRASDAIPGYELADLKRPFATDVGAPAVSRKRREAWGDFVVWDSKDGKPAAVSRDDIGEYFHERGVDPALEGEYTIEIDGKPVAVRPVFDLVREHLRATWSPENISKVTWAPASAVRSLARQIAANPERTLFITGMGPNQMFNADQKDRAIFLVAALTRNVGFKGGATPETTGPPTSTGCRSTWRKIPLTPSWIPRKCLASGTRSGCSPRTSTRMGTRHSSSATKCSTARATCRFRPRPSGSLARTRFSATPRAITTS
jgi:nitrate reductase alpha subunit